MDTALAAAHLFPAFLREHILRLLALAVQEGIARSGRREVLRDRPALPSVQGQASVWFGAEPGARSDSVGRGDGLHRRFRESPAKSPSSENPEASTATIMSPTRELLCDYPVSSHICEATDCAFLLNSISSMPLS